ncbi:MAG TPA: DNA polymerase I [Candidatus Gastranaerophilales bacterium]|nr:DNA polymerase I [Candidatus Gastranaerophilales bacterium]
MESKTLILIDGHALAYRQYFALERTGMKTTDNFPTWAVYGFMKAMFDLLKHVKPDAIAVSFDKGRETFRLKAYPEYKANRQVMPNSLKEQFSAIIEGVQAFNIPIYEMAGFEADDIIGTISEKARQLGHKTLILTGDQDSFQLVDPEKHVIVLIPSKGELIEYDRDKIHQKLGVYPENVIDLKGLQGDTSDNIPGVKGVGAKTAVKLIEEYHSVENIYEHLGEISSASLREKLEKDHEMAIKSKFLATICRNVPIDFDFEHTHVALPDVDKITAFMKKYQFNSLLKMLPEILTHCCKTDIEKATQSNGQAVGQMKLNLEAAIEKVELSKTFKVATQIVDTEEKFKEFLEKLNKQEVFSLDTETTSANVFDAKLVGISIGWNPHIKVLDNQVVIDKTDPDSTETFYIPVGHVMGQQLKAYYVLQKLKPALENVFIYKILQNAKYEIHIFKGLDIELNGIIMDTMLASYVKEPAFKHGLKQQAFIYLGYEMTPIEELIGKGKQQITMDQTTIETAADYACGDAKSTLELGGYYAEKLTAEEKNVLYEIEQPLTPALTEMERAGISIDTEYLKELSNELQENIEKIENKIFELAGEKFNVNSPKQVGEVLFEKLKISTKGMAKTQTGFSTSANALESLKNEHPIASLLLSHRHYAKLKSTYVDTLPALVNKKTGRIHTSFNQTVTTTGRLSSSDPNLQNIPIRTEIGNRIRAAFVPEDRENAVILSADYSQIELRLLAHISEDEALVEAFNQGQDIHTDTAAKVFNVKSEEVTSEQRRAAKTVNFGIIYGQSSYGLSETLKISPAEAKDIIEKYFATYPKIKQYMDKTAQQARETGYVSTIYGRRRYLKEDIHSRIRNIREFAERAAINSPLQGTAADIIKIAMIKLYHQLKNSNLKSKLILQVHDELVLEVPKNEIDEIKRIVTESMELGQPFKVPLVIDIACGPSWLEVKE